MHTVDKAKIGCDSCIYSVFVTVRRRLFTLKNKNKNKNKNKSKNKNKEQSCKVLTRKLTLVVTNNII
jgi:hypothetical protein